MKNKLLLLAVALLTSWSVKAVDVIEEGKDYYIMNVETDLFLGGQNYWGTQGAISTDAGIFQFVPGTTGEGYNIMNTLVSVSNKYLGTNLYTDNNGQMPVKDDEEAGTTKNVDGIWDIVNQGGGVFAFYCRPQWAYDAENGWVETPHGYLAKSETAGYRKGFELAFSETLTDACLFYVFTYDEALQYMVNKAQSSNVSFNFLIKNPDFCRNQSVSAWGFYSPSGGTNHNYAGGANNNFCAESYHCDFVCSQVVKDLPAGRYQLSAQGFYRQDGSDNDNMPCAYVGPYATPLAKAMIPLKTTSENSMTDASNSFQAGKFMIDPIRFNLEEKTDLEIGFQCMNKSMWVIWDNIQLMSYSNVAEYGQEILAGISYPIEGLASSDVRAAYEAAYNSFKSFVEGIQQGRETFDQVDEEYAKFTAAETALKESIASWSGYTVVAEKAKSLYTQITSQEGKFQPNTALNALDVYANASASAGTPGTVASGYTFVNGNYAYIKDNPTLNDEQITAEIAFVNSLMNDVKKKSVKDGMDVTFLLTNADFKDTNVGNGWTREQSGSVNWNLRSGLSGWPVSETYIPANGSTFDIYQVVEGAPAGLYKVSINAFHRPAGAWDADTKVPVALYMGGIANPIQNIAAGAILNDLTWDDETQTYLDGEVAKNGTNCYFWDGNSAKDDAAKAAIWAGNQNEDPEIQAMIAGSTSLTGAGKYNSDSQYNETYLIPNGMDGSSIAFSAGRYPMVVYGEVADEGDGVGTLRIGLKSTEPLNNGAWTLWGGFKLELAGTDPTAMRDLLKGKMDEMDELVPDRTVAPGISEVLLDSISNSYADAEELYNNPVLQDYQNYKDAYDELEHLIGSANKYLTAYSKYSSDWTKLNNMIANFDPGTDEKKAETKAKAQNVSDAFNALVGSNFIALTQEDLDNMKEFEVESGYDEPEELTEENMADAAAAGTEGGWVTTYDAFNGFYAKYAEQLDCIYLTVEGVGTAEYPEDLTEQLRNTDLMDTETQWWGTAWGALGSNGAAEHYEKVFDTYQMVNMPAGYYTLVGYGMDRRGSWADVLANDENWGKDYRTTLYAKVGKDDTIQENVVNGLDIASTVDVTEGSGSISTYQVGDPAVTYYAPNSMAQYRAWEDAKELNNGHVDGTELKFQVYEDGSFSKLGFVRRSSQGMCWFIADGIQLFYAKDGYPVTTGIVAPTSLEKYGKADGKYLEKGKIVIYNNGKKFNTAGQIVK